MAEEKIAILVDSGSDVPMEYRDRYSMYVAPLTIIYKDAEYRDGVDIQPEDVFRRFAEEIPSTSLPSPSAVVETFRQIRADGYEKVIVVAISSGLSGTYEMLRSHGPAPEGLEAYYVDTKNIGIGSGFSAIRAGELIETGLPFTDVCRKVEEAAQHTKLFFCVSTLKYLAKGGRIGLVAARVGTILDLKPVISCNEDGVYDTVAKARGRKRSLRLALEKTVEAAAGATEYNITVMHGAAKEEADELLAALKERLPNSRYAVEGQITPALVVHTGPGLIGVGVQCLS
ncbi:MAG TPA: DegV family protein [Coriobacteriia bacterium]|nr:DegV family protein [Coriobacteriia bacterium]